MDKKEQIILLYKTGMYKEAIAKHCVTDVKYVKQIIKDYKSSISYLKYYKEKFKLDENFKLSVIVTFFSILIAIGSLVYAYHSNKQLDKKIIELKDLQINHTSLSESMKEQILLISEAVRTNETQKLKILYNLTLKGKEKLNTIFGEVSGEFYKRAVIAKNLGRYKEAVYFFEKVIEFNASENLEKSEFWFDYGVSLIHAKDEGLGLNAWYKAIESNKKAILLSKNQERLNAGAYLNLFYLYHKIGDLKEDKDTLKQLINYSDEYLSWYRYVVKKEEFKTSPAWFSRGFGYFELGNYSEAILSFNNIKLGEEYYFDAQIKKAYAFYELEQNEEALIFVSSVLDNPQANFSNEGNYKEGLLLYSILLKEKGIKEKNAQLIYKSWEIFSKIEPEIGFAFSGMCQHGAHLVGIITGNETEAINYYNYCEEQQLLRGIRIRPITPYDIEVTVDTLFNYTKN